MDHLYIIVYDIREQKRWRKVFRLLHGYGEWLQLSVFQCRLSRSGILQLEASLESALNLREDHLMILDLGVAENVELRVKSLGQAFSPVEKGAVIV